MPEAQINFQAIVGALMDDGSSDAQRKTALATLVEAHFANQSRIAAALERIASPVISEVVSAEVRRLIDLDRQRRP